MGDLDGMQYCIVLYNNENVHGIYITEPQVKLGNHTEENECVNAIVRSDCEYVMLSPFGDSSSSIQLRYCENIFGRFLINKTDHYSVIG
jgi:hypothetical protein